MRRIDFNPAELCWEQLHTGYRDGSNWSNGVTTPFEGLMDHIGASLDIWTDGPESGSSNFWNEVDGGFWPKLTRMHLDLISAIILSMEMSYVPLTDAITAEGALLRSAAETTEAGDVDHEARAKAFHALAQMSSFLAQVREFVSAGDGLHEALVAIDPDPMG